MCKVFVRAFPLSSSIRAIASATAEGSCCEPKAPRMAPSSSCTRESPSVLAVPFPSVAGLHGGAGGTQVWVSANSGAVFALPFAFPAVGTIGCLRRGDLGDLRRGYAPCCHVELGVVVAEGPSMTFCQWPPHQGQCIALPLFITLHTLHFQDGPEYAIPALCWASRLSALTGSCEREWCPLNVFSAPLTTPSGKGVPVVYARRTVRALVRDLLARLCHASSL